MIFFLGIITVFSDKGILGICSFLERGIEVQVIGGEGMRGGLTVNNDNIYCCLRESCHGSIKLSLENPPLVYDMVSLCLDMFYLLTVLLWFCLVGFWQMFYAYDISCIRLSHMISKVSVLILHVLAAN